MRIYRWPVWLSLAVAACTPVPSTYSCTGASMCFNGLQGACESTGFCSFPDESCPSGRRYGELSGSYASQCATNPAGTVSVGGTINGLTGTGLVLENNGADDLAITADGSFTFPTPIASGSTYAITISSQPSGQTCSISGGAGTVGDTDVTTVAVNCGPQKYTIGGTITGLDGSVVLQNNGGDNLVVTANGSFAFPAPLAPGASYAVTVLTQPSYPPRTQVCTVANGSGIVAATDVTSVAVTCVSNSYTVGGMVSGLSGKVVLQNNGGDDLMITANGFFTFATPVASGDSFAVTVLTQPGYPPRTQTCVVNNGSGTIVSSTYTAVAVTCTTNTYTIGGMVSGLNGTVVLQDNNGDNLSISASGGFTFATSVASGNAFAVSVLTQPGYPPYSQTCTVTNGSGTVMSANITTVTVACVTNTFTIGGTVSSLVGSGMVLQNNNADDLPIAASGGFTFATSIASGNPYAVSIKTQPSGQTCSVSGSSGTVGGTNVTSVVVNCASNTFTIGGMVSGLNGTVVLQDNGGDNLSLTANGSFSFATPLANGNTYSVTVQAQPGYPPHSQTCTVTNSAGTVTGANVTNVTVTCVTNKYTIGGMVSGLTGTGLVLQDNGADNLPVTASGGFTFATSIASGNPYAVTVLNQPSGQTCSVSSGAGTVGGSNVIGVAVACTSTGSVTLVQHQTATADSAKTLSLMLPVATTPGQLLIMVGSASNAGLSNVTGGGVVSWSTAAVSQSNANCEIWYGVVTTSSTSPITITVPVTSPMWMDVSQWSGLVTTQSQVLDNASGLDGVSGSASAGSITTTHAADLIVFAAGDYTPNVFGTPSSGPWSTLSALVAGTAGNQYQSDSWYQSVAATGAYSPSVSQTGDGWDACIAAFKIAP